MSHNIELSRAVYKAVYKFNAPAKWCGEYDRLTINTKGELRKLILDELDWQTYEEMLGTAIGEEAEALAKSDDIGNDIFGIFDRVFGSGFDTEIRAAYRLLDDESRADAYQENKSMMFGRGE